MYDIKEITLKNKQYEKKRKIITFHDEAMTIVGEFLMTDAPLMDGKVLHIIERVIQGKEETATFTGQRCQLMIAKDETTIVDLYAERPGMTKLASYTIDTITLLDLIHMWLQRLSE